MLWCRFTVLDSTAVIDCDASKTSRTRKSYFQTVGPENLRCSCLNTSKFRDQADRRPVCSLESDTKCGTIQHRRTLVRCERTVLQYFYFYLLSSLPSWVRFRIREGRKPMQGGWLPQSSLTREHWMKRRWVLRQAATETMTKQLTSDRDNGLHNPF